MQPPFAGTPPATGARGGVELVDESDEISTGPFGPV